MDEGRAGDGSRIGAIAAEFGLNPKTIRYDEEIRLPSAPRRDASGYRRSGLADRDRLRFIVKAKTIGLTLREIDGILALRENGTEPCSHVRDLIDRKLATVDAQLRRLAAARAELLAVRAEAASTPCSAAPICGVIEFHTAKPRD